MVDWLALDNDISRIPEISHTQLIAANVYYGSIGKLIEGHFYFEDFEALVVEGFSLAKIVKISASSSSANGSSDRFLGL